MANTDRVAALITIDSIAGDASAIRMRDAGALVDALRADPALDAAAVVDVVRFYLRIREEPSGSVDSGWPISTGRFA